jgi:hypothetical protein
MSILTSNLTILIHNRERDAHEASYRNIIRNVIARLASYLASYMTSLNIAAIRSAAVSDRRVRRSISSLPSGARWRRWLRAKRPHTAEESACQKSIVDLARYILYKNVDLTRGRWPGN